jgi:hypothetical protein
MFLKQNNNLRPDISHDKFIAFRITSLLFNSSLFFTEAHVIRHSYFAVAGGRGLWRNIAETCVWKPANVRISNMSYLLANDSKTLFNFL